MRLIANASVSGGYCDAEKSRYDDKIVGTKTALVISNTIPSIRYVLGLYLTDNMKKPSQQG